MHKLGILIGAASLVFLSGCGGGNKINATNADTLRSSLSKVAKSMPEIERQKFGQDVILAYEAATNEQGRILSQSTLYSDNYSILFASESSEEQLFFADAFKDIALKAGSALDGKTPASLAKDAKAIRSDNYKKLVESLEKTNEDLGKNRDEIKTAKQAHEKTNIELQAKNEELEQQRKSVVDNIKIEKISMNRSLRVTMTGTADIKNYTDKPVTRVGFEIKADLPEVPGHFYKSRPQITLETPLAPNATLKDYPLNFSNNVFSSIVRNPDAQEVKFNSLIGTIKASNPTSELVKYAHPREPRNPYPSTELKLDRTEQSTLNRYENTIKNCDTSFTQINETIEASKKYIETVKGLIKDPKPLTENAPRYSSFRNGC